MKKNQIILIIVGVLILIGLVSGFDYWQKQIQLKTEISVPVGEKTEISQEEAIEMVLERYPGEVFSIEKKIFEVEKETEENQTFWVIGVNLITSVEEPSIDDEAKRTNKIWIRVNVETKEMSVQKLGDNNE